LGDDVLVVLAPLMAAQHGLVHLAQARALGLGEDVLHRAATAGVVTRRQPAVYALAGAPRTWHQELMAAVLDAGDGAAASHRAAAILLGIAGRGAARVVEISVPRPRNSRMAGVVVHRSGDLVPEHVVQVDGIPCTGPLRTLVDLGAVERWPIVSDAFERALQSGQATLRGAEWMLTELSQRGRAGCGVFRRVLDERALVAVSPHEGLLEPRMARLLRAAELPHAAYQHVVTHRGQFVAQVDFAYVELKEAFEVDGFETHGTPKAMAGDFEREHDLRAAGWGVTRFTWFHVVKRPRYVASVVREVLGAHSRA
jgi:very-short-patch-repair endonuclease